MVVTTIPGTSPKLYWKTAKYLSIFIFANHKITKVNIAMNSKVVSQSLAPAVCTRLKLIYLIINCLIASFDGLIRTIDWCKTSLDVDLVLKCRQGLKSSQHILCAGQNKFENAQACTGYYNIFWHQVPACMLAL